MSSVTLDWDDKVDISGIYAPPTPPFQPIQPVSQGISSASSIEKIEEKTISTRERPRLEPPKRHYMIDLLEVHQRVEGAVSKELIVFKAQSKVDLAEIERLEKEKEETLRKSAEDAAARANWNVLISVAQYLAAGTSIAVGVSLGATGWGGFLIASGVAGLSQKVIHDTVGWQSVASWFTKSVETQKQLVKRIEMGFLYVELGTGLFGGMGAAATGAFSALAADTSRLMAARKLSSTIQAAGTGMKITAQMGRTVAEKRMSDLSARMRMLDGQAERVRMEMSSQVTDARNMIDTAQEVGRELHKAIAGAEIQDL